MTTIAEGWAGTGGGLLLGDQRRKLEESVQALYNAYLEGPFILPPDQLISQLKEQGPDLLYDLVQQLQWETLGAAGYTQDLTAERARAIDESRRLWKYNPLAQWMIWLWTNYGFGENIVITPEDEDAVETWEEFWKADRNQAVLAQDRIADKLSNWLLVDGDRFLALYASTLDGETTIRRINTKEITEIVTDPDDSNVPLFYKRQWSNTKNQQMTWYYPDHQAFFDGTLDRAELPMSAVRADEQNDQTTVVILHIAFNGKDEDSLYGWPLLAAGSPWIRAQKRHLENRLAVSASKAMYARIAKVSGGSRQVDHVIANLRSALSGTQRVETNPSAVPGSTLVENQAVNTTDLPMTTGASDAKTDGEMFSWMAGLSGGVFPHYLGMGDAYRLATATSMEKPLEMQFSRYQVFWGAQFRKKVRIVLQFKEKYGDVTFQTYEAEVSTDKMVEVDLDGMSQALGRVFQTIINPQAKLGAMPAKVTKGMLQASLRTILQALGVDAEAVIGDDVWPEAEEEEGELEEAIALALQNYRSGLVDADDLVAFLVPSRLEEVEGPGSGWWGPPKGTHGTGRQVQVGITSARPGKTIEQVTKEMDEFRALMEKTPVTNLSVHLGTGGWEGGSEPTWVTQYDGDGEAIKVLAQAGKKWDQDAVLVMRHVTEGGQPQTRLAFAETIDMPEMREIGKVLVSEGIGGWTWAQGKDGPILIATSIPQWGGESEAHIKASSAIQGILKGAGYDVGLKTLYVDVTVMERDTYDDFIGD